MPHFEYGEIEINYLKKKDKKLSAAIDRIGRIYREINPDVFSSLIEGIVSQQISTKAATTVYNRILELVGVVTPYAIGNLDVEVLQKCGISMRKAGYINGIASTVLDNTLDLNALNYMCDNDVCKELSSLRGIGVWTAEMLMTFSMQRLDIFSFGDLAIHRGLRVLYRHKEITRELFEKYRKRYSPYGSVASLYLWEISNWE